MYLRIFSTSVLILGLVGCKAKQAPDPIKQAEHIACALDNAQTFAPDCKLERIDGGLIVHRPDGGFRRFTSLPDGGGLAASDGQEIVAQKLDGAMLEVAVGDDRYRIPVAVKANAKP